MATQTMKLPKQFDVILDIINQIFEIERKAEKLQESHSIQRNIDKLKDILEHQISILFFDTGFIYENPIGEDYNETRTDCTASIAGESTENLVIVEVIKPIIRVKQNNFTQIIQKAVVVVQSKD
jgi:hypothetical protein